MLLAVPNVSEGRDRTLIDRIGAAFCTNGVELLDIHSDADHNRSVYSLAGSGEALLSGLLAGVGEAVNSIDMAKHEGEHPCIGALDVAPVVYLNAADQEKAQDLARDLASRLANKLELPVFIYGEMATSEERSHRSFYRSQGPSGLAERMRSGKLKPDFGPETPHPTAVATLVTARPPLVAFNLELDTDEIGPALAIATKIRESNGGPKGIRAVAVDLDSYGCAQVSINVEQPEQVALAQVVELVEREASRLGTAVKTAEIVGMVPQAALEGFPDELPIRGFNPLRQVIERRLPSI